MPVLWKKHHELDFYEVAEDGRVRLAVARRYFAAGYEPSQRTSKSTGYVNISYRETCSGKNLQSSVHIMVAEMWVPNPDNLPEVNHKDGNKENNHKDNLEWCTHKENMAHAQKNGLMPIQEGEKNGMAKLDADRVRLMRSLRKFGLCTFKDLGDAFGISFQQASSICNRKSWRHVA